MRRISLVVMQRDHRQPMVLSKLNRISISKSLPHRLLQSLNRITGALYGMVSGTGMTTRLITGDCDISNNLSTGS